MPTLGAWHRIEWFLPWFGIAWLTVVVLAGNPLNWLHRQRWSDKNAPLPDRLIGMSKDLEGLLQQVGPERQPTWWSGITGPEFMEANKDVQTRERTLEAMFERRFRLRVIDIYNEACETGTIEDLELEGILRSTRMDHDAPIRKIVERLKHVAAELFKQR